MSNGQFKKSKLKFKLKKNLFSAQNSLNDDWMILKGFKKWK